MSTLNTIFGAWYFWIYSDSKIEKQGKLPAVKDAIGIQGAIKMVNGMLIMRLTFITVMILFIFTLGFCNQLGRVNFKIAYHGVEQLSEEETIHYQKQKYRSRLMNSIRK